MTNGTLEGKHKRLIEEMNAVEVRKIINEKTVAILVFGACENHGDHMPFGSDFIFPAEIAKRVATNVSNVIVLPAIPYGVSLHHDKFQMTMSINPETMIGIISDLLTSLIQNKIRRACLESWWVLVGQLKKDLFEVWNGLGHGGEAETSAVLAVRPDLVNLASAPKDVIPRLPENIRIFWKFDELTSTGATGAPQKANIKKGNEILRMLEDILISFIKEMESLDWKYGLYLK